MFRHANKQLIQLFSTLSLIALTVSPLSGSAFAAEPSPLLIQHIETAKGYMNANQWNYANYEWRAALTQDPQNVEANIGLAETLLQGGFIPDAVKHLESVRQSISKLSLELEYGKALEMAQDFVTAEKVYLQNLERVPLEPKSFTRLIAILSSLPEAERVSLQAYLEKTTNYAAEQGRVFLRKKNYAEAARHFEISTMLKRSITDLNDYGLSLLLLGRYDEAFQQFNMLKHAKLDNWELYANSAFVALGQGNPFEAATNLEKAIGLCNVPAKKPMLYNDLGFIYENQNKWQKARNAYARAVALDPSFTKAKLNLAFAYQKDMAYADAIKTYQEILLQEPENATVLNSLGFVYELANKERLALQAYKKATDVKPFEQEGYYNLAILYKKMGKNKESDMAYKDLMDIEFNKMEAGKTKNNKLSGNALSSKDSKDSRDSKNRLLDYVDVFFSPSTPTTPST